MAIYSIANCEFTRGYVNMLIYVLATVYYALDWNILLKLRISGNPPFRTVSFCAPNLGKLLRDCEGNLTAKKCRND